jgi:TonB dependent receptor-like, beta-barrel
MFGIVIFLMAAQFAQSSTGELRLRITDPAGLPLESHASLVSEGNDFLQTFDTDADGVILAKRLPFGRYRLEVTRPGFATYATLVDIQSALPTEYRVTLTLLPVQAQVTVSADATMLDVRQSSTVQRIGEALLQRRMAALPGRALSDVVNTQPGWLLEANGILHPRGSEYQVQYVVDGLPLTDNRSPSFAPELDVDSVHALSIVTAGYPAEYGRKLGGIIEVVSVGTGRQGFHGSAAASAGSFGTATGSGAAQYGWRRTMLGASAAVAHTDRYLDPPVEENFSNSGTGSHLAAQFEHESSVADRVGVVVRHAETRFVVPNERVQQEAGQRQERRIEEIVAQASYQHVFSGNMVGDVRGMARSLTAGLASNALSTPIAAEQNRGFREGYVKATILARNGAHEWKAGLDGDFGSVRETFGYRISDPAQFDPETPRAFSFADRRVNAEQAIFVQDRIGIGPWSVNAGLRWDHYALVVAQSALSPRLSVAWSWPSQDLILRASYDRAFQTPALENLLLASSSKLDALSDNVLRLPVRPSLGNFFDVGISKRLFSKLRLDVTHFYRGMSNFADDDVLLNTGISFPIAFRDARIRGSEVKIDVPAWRAISAFASYSNMVGSGSLPISGGLLLGDDIASQSSSTERFPISQDQRHTARARITYDLSTRTSLSLAGSYGSGLPVEFDGDIQQGIAQYGPRIVERVDLERGRVASSASLDASINYAILKTDTRRVVLQADVTNLTNRLNVINFAGLFSGTALAPPRSFAVRLRAAF